MIYRSLVIHTVTIVTNFVKKNTNAESINTV